MDMNLNNSLQAQVQVNRVNLENKTVENEDKTLISLRSSFSELVFDQSSFEWHQDQSYLDLLRVRFILCMSDRNAPALDYIAQRFSEFQEKTRLEATPVNPRDRNLNLEEFLNLRDPYKFLQVINFHDLPHQHPLEREYWHQNL